MEDEKWLTQHKGAKQLNVSERHCWRLQYEQGKTFLSKVLLSFIR